MFTLERAQGLLPQTVKANIHSNGSLKTPMCEGIIETIPSGCLTSGIVLHPDPLPFVSVLEQDLRNLERSLFGYQQRSLSQASTELLPPHHTKSTTLGITPSCSTQVWRSCGQSFLGCIRKREKEREDKSREREGRGKKKEGKEEREGGGGEKEKIEEP